MAGGSADTGCIFERQTGVPVETCWTSSACAGKAKQRCRPASTRSSDFKYDGLGFATLAFNNTSGIGRPGTGTLKVDGKAVSIDRPCSHLNFRF
jgi:hypothetical protein